MPPLRFIRIVVLSFALLAAVTAASQSCCSMTSEELGAIQGTNDDCPMTYNRYDVQNVNKCETCPSGTCRVNGKCFCPKNFANGYEGRESGGAWSQCKYSFGESWPESVGKEDVTWRSCQDEVKVPDFGTKSCCQLTEKELKAASGTSDLCPLSYNHRDVKSINKCEPCPPGTCRVNSKCYCPKNFLDGHSLTESRGTWKNCEYSFGETWPKSIEKEDVNWRSCQDGVKVTDFGSKSCCELTEKELTAASGTSDLCPGTYNHRDVKSINKCETCPSGTCRVGLECFCPRNFFDAYEGRESRGAWSVCESSFTKKWPDSIGKEDVDWRSCAKQDPVTTEISNPSSSAGSSGGTDSKTDSSSGGGGDDDIDSGGEAEVKKDSDGENDADGEDKGMNWEMWGGIFGGIGTFATIAFGLVGWWYSRRNRAGSESSLG